MPPAFALSQDQTLRFINANASKARPKRTQPKKHPQDELDPTHLHHARPQDPTQTLEASVNAFNQRYTDKHHQALKINQDITQHTLNAQNPPQSSRKPDPLAEIFRRRQRIPSIPDVIVKEQWKTTHPLLKERVSPLAESPSQRRAESFNGTGQGLQEHFSSGSGVLGASLDTVNP